MKKVGIITIIGDNNYGNRLQNYAVQQVLIKLNVEPETIINKECLNIKEKNKIKYGIKVAKHNIKKFLKKYLKRKEVRRVDYFYNFDNNIVFSKNIFDWFRVNKMKKYDNFIIGSDQVWNPTFNRLNEFDLAIFAEGKQRISFSASFGISELPEQCKELTAQELKKFKSISVREDAGKRIVEELTGRTDVEVLADPTMLLTAEEWDKVSKKPEQLKTKKYILNYFLGNLSEQRKMEIDRIAKENDCEVINILDKESPFYKTGPSEFLYLEKNAFLICTDSFHSCVFAILYNRPFIIFDREDNIQKMNSRIETLINKFNLENREFTGKITEKNLQHDYTNAYKILEEERKKSMDFLKKALDLEG